MNNEMEIIWNDVEFAPKHRIKFQSFNQDTWRLDRDSNRAPLGYKSGILPLDEPFPSCTL
jgi:hypothetical protein